MQLTEAASECGGSESGAASTSKVVEEGAVASVPSATVHARPQHLELLPPPPKIDGKRSTQVSLYADYIYNELYTTLYIC